MAVRAWQMMRHPTRRGVLLTIGAIPGALVLYVLVLIPLTPSISDIRRAKVDRPAQILSSDNKLLAEFKPSHREWVGLSDISPDVVGALIATEDHRFYDHHGLDWRRTASAALHTFGGDRQGGSTITQQLARNLYPEDIGRAPTLTRKLKEAITAFKIEALYTKPEILETYLNTVPFLYNAYGIEMAARTYFDKSADALDVVEAATLIGMLKGNSYYNPVLNPERAVERRNVVLAQMAKRGVLDEKRLVTLQKRPLRVDFERQMEPPGPAPHFAQQLRKWLIAWADRNDYNIYSDGLIVRTTIDSRLQGMAAQALTYQANQLQSIADAAWSSRGGWRDSAKLLRAFVRETPEFRAARDAGQAPDVVMKRLLADKVLMQTLRQTKTRVQAGFMALDPRTGEIRAWVGSRDFAQDPFDHVQQARRQPGSTFKPFVYGAAFAKGKTPDDTLVDQAVEIPLAGGEVWRPTDATPPSQKPMTLRDGLVYSRNSITAQLMQTVGPSRVVGLARAMGVRDSKLDAVPSLALGTSPVSLYEMVSAYGTIANEGQYHSPLMVTRIEDAHGRVLAEFTPSAPERALSVADDYTLVSVMREVINRGTGSAIRSRFGIRADVAGKTGTTQDNADGWFLLMHPELVAGAWVGFNDSRVTLRSDYWGQGARSALPMVGDFFSRALRARIVDANAKFQAPETSSGFEGWLRRARNWVMDLFASKPASMSLPQSTPKRLTPPSNTQASEAEAPEAGALASDVWAPMSPDGIAPDSPDLIVPSSPGISSGVSSPAMPMDGGQTPPIVPLTPPLPASSPSEGLSPNA